MEILLLCLAVGILGLVAHSFGSEVRWARLLRDQVQRQDLERREVDQRHDLERKEWFRVIKDLHDRIHAADIPSYLTLQQNSKPIPQAAPARMTDEDEARLEAQRKPLFPRV